MVAGGDEFFDLFVVVFAGFGEVFGVLGGGVWFGEVVDEGLVCFLHVGVAEDLGGLEVGLEYFEVSDLGFELGVGVGGGGVHGVSFVGGVCVGVSQRFLMYLYSTTLGIVSASFGNGGGACLVGYALLLVVVHLLVGPV